MIAYRIRDWSKHFENNRSRAVEKLTWVPVPNGHDGEGFATIMGHEKAAEIFSAWILILQVASRCEVRGDLVRGDGTPHDSASLAMRTRAKAKWFDIAIPILLQVRWIESFAVECQSNVSQTSVACQSGDEGRKEGKEGNGTPAAAQFTDLDFLKALRQNPAYDGVDFDRELGKMDAWLLTPRGRGRKKTRQFVVNWLNKADRSMAPSPKPKPQGLENIRMV